MKPIQMSALVTGRTKIETIFFRRCLVHSDKVDGEAAPIGSHKLAVLQPLATRRSGVKKNGQQEGESKLHLTFGAIQ